MFIRPGGLFLAFVAVCIGVGLFVTPFAHNPPSGAPVLAVVGVAVLLGGGWLGLRLFKLGLEVRGESLIIRNFKTTTRVPIVEIRSIALRQRRGYGGDEWVGYLEKVDGTGFWLWSTEAGPAWRPPHERMVAQLQSLCDAIRVTLDVVGN
jgi:hypothetical protein